ncbi:MAG: S-layer homology domain-containing protein [Chloroflexia bacterium]
MSAQRRPRLAVPRVTLTVALLANLVLTGLGLFAVLPVAAATYDVCAVGCDFTSIQSAVNAASNGDTIVVRAGVYQEQVFIDESLTFVGAGVGQTTILAPASMTSTHGGEVAAIVEIDGEENGAAVDMSGFTIAGPATICQPPTFYGIFVGGGGYLNLRNSEVRDIRPAPSPSYNFGCGFGSGIRFGSDFLGETGTGSLSNVSIYNYEKTGVIVDGAGSDAFISDSTITGVGSNTTIAQNGVQISRGATADIDYSTISENLCDRVGSPDLVDDPACGPGQFTATNQTQATGVLIFDPGGPVSIIGSTINNNDIGVQALGTIGYGGGPLDLAVISSLITGNRWQGLALYDGSVLLDSNEIVGPSLVGVLIAELGLDDANTNLELLNNAFVLNSGRAVQITDYDTGGGNPDTVFVQARHNSIGLVGNGVGVENNTTSTADFAYNWWGSPRGPQAFPNPGGDGVALSGNVDYTGWLIDGTDTSDARGFQQKAGCGATNFSDVAESNPYCEGISVLAGYGIIRGYSTNPPSFGPNDPVERAQIAAFIVRALQWQDEPTGPRDFSDLNGLPGDLATAVRILANACDGFGGADCVAEGYGDGRFGPSDKVSYGQVIAFITRAFGMDGFFAWDEQPGAPLNYSGVPSQFQLEVRTYDVYAGPIPGAPTTAAGWNSNAPREWVAQVLYQAFFSGSYALP